VTASDFTPSKVVCQIVMTRELVDALTDAGIRALGRELRAAVAVGSDTAFLAALSGNESEAMGADSWSGFLEDLEEGLRLLQLGVGSRVYAVVSPELGKVIAMQAAANGITTLAWRGGNLAGVEIIVSDAQTANRLSLISADGVAIAMGEIDLRSSGQATVEMSDTPSQEATTPTAANQVSMFQTNSRCLLAEQSFALKAVRASAYAHLSNVSLGEDSGSPAGI
jgi:hypothetical protein